MGIAVFAVEIEFADGGGLRRRSDGGVVDSETTRTNKVCHREFAIPRSTLVSQINRICPHKIRHI